MSKAFGKANVMCCRMHGSRACNKYGGDVLQYMFTFRNHTVETASFSLSLLPGRKTSSGYLFTRKAHRTQQAVKDTDNSPVKTRTILN